jgi:hypothetical protein
MAWGKRYPVQDLDICVLIRTAFMAKYGHEWNNEYGGDVIMRIVGGGPPLNIECYIGEKGIQKSASDTSCPFFQLGTPNECVIWGRAQLPPSCANFPQSFTNEAQMIAWEINHPHTSQGGLCGYYWIDV